MAAIEPNTDWISWEDLHQRALTKFHNAPARTAPWLQEQFVAGKLRWRYWECYPYGWSKDLFKDKPRRLDEPVMGDPAAWRQPHKVCWEEGRLEVVNMFGDGRELHGIEVLRADAEALGLLPTEPQQPALAGMAQLSAMPGLAAAPAATELPGPELLHPDAQNTARWLTEEAKRMKAAGEIRAGISKTEWSEKLATQMKDAAEARRLPSHLRPVSALYIRDKLSAWDIYPIDQI